MECKSVDVFCKNLIFSPEKDWFEKNINEETLKRGQSRFEFLEMRRQGAPIVSKGCQAPENSIILSFSHFLKGEF